MKKQFKANGKLLLSGEYGVLDGAKALALPTKMGQTMTISNTRGSDLIWEAIDNKGEKWFKSNVSLYDFSPVKTTDEVISKNLQQILKNCVRQNSEFLSKWNGFKVQTKLEFDRSWGLGSSSTLYCLVAEWAEINPLVLYFEVEDGSGYDVAAGWADGPMVYTSGEEEISYSEVEFDPSFKDQLYFVYSGQKQDTKQGVTQYRKLTSGKKSLIKSLTMELTDITNSILEANSLKTFNKLIDTHEDVVSKYLYFPKVKDTHFKDYPGSIKSLGAWGGDFLLATSEESPEATKKYFSDKGLEICLPYRDIIL